MKQKTINVTESWKKVIGLTEGENTENGGGVIFEQVMGDHFPEILSSQVHDM